MFLQPARSNPEPAEEVFGDETETTEMSVLAAAEWRSVTDDERKVCLPAYGKNRFWFAHTVL